MTSNAVAAVSRKEDGEIVVNVSQDEGRVLMQVRDSGEGMTPEVARTVLERGGSFTPHGHGLGLSYIKTVCKEYYGALNIDSEWMTGTTATLSFPRPLTPDWIVNEIRVPSDARIIIIDDDSTIHDLWRRKFKDFDCKFLFRPEDGLAADLFIVDQEIRGCGETGLKFIERAGIRDRAILSTGHISDLKIQSEVQRIGCKFLPKFLAADIPISTQDLPAEVDLVLIDDDIVTRQSWELMARIKGKKIAVFESYESFTRTSLPRDVPLYIDRTLGNGEIGDAIAAQLRTLGFKQLNLISGDDRALASKEFPV